MSIDHEYLTEFLLKLLQIHSPTGYTDPIVRMLCEEIESLGLDYELTRRGAISVRIKGKEKNPARAIVGHLDTLGAMVKNLKDNGRLSVVPVGSWSARFAEGARVSIFTDESLYRGTILPLKASGHTFNEEIDSQPVSWNNVEIRIDAESNNLRDLVELGINVGDFVGIDASTEILPNGYIVSRHLDDKAGVAAMMAALKAILDEGVELSTDFQILFTISEEVGSGASAIQYGDIAELVAIDNATCAPGQNSDELGVTFAMADSSGPFDYHLTHRLIHLCQNNNLRYARDVFKYYRCDSASAVEAGNDIRTALVAFGVDASHGYERTHLRSLVAVAQLIKLYMMSEPLYENQKRGHNTLKEFPETRLVEFNSVLQNESESIAQKPPEKDDETE